MRFVYDIETYPNYFLVVIQNIETQEIHSFTIDDIPELVTFMADIKKEFVGFNSFEYDDVLIKWIITQFLKGVKITCGSIKKMSNKIIKTGCADQTILGLTYHPDKKIFGGQLVPWKKSYDLMNIHLSGQSLKKHGAALKLMNVQDLPYHHEKKLTKAEMDTVYAYCLNDIHTTLKLYESMTASIQTRQDLADLYPFMDEYSHSMTEPQIAERYVRHEYERVTGAKVKKITKPDSYYFDFSVDIDPNISFEDDDNQEALDNLRAIGRVRIPQIPGTQKFDDKEIMAEVKQHTFSFGLTEVQLGLGGLHSEVTPMCLLSPDKTIAEADVSSYYPHLMLNIGEAPSHLSGEWLDIVRDMIDLRLKYKAEGNKSAANSLKILINSIYGKLGSGFSSFVDQRLKYCVTLNGQLWLLRLAEMLHDSGFKLYAGNTDGIYFEVGDRRELASELIEEWALLSNLPIEPVYGYDALIIRNINSYAARINGDWKLKKDFKPNVNQFPEIISTAVLKHLVDGMTIHDAVRDSEDILEYVWCTGTSKASSKSVVDKLTWNNHDIQFVNRFYRGVNGSPITIHKTNKENGTKSTSQAPKSSNAMVVNRITSNDIPKDMDYLFYEREVRKIVASVLNEDPFDRELGLSYNIYESNQDSHAEKNRMPWGSIVSKFTATEHIELGSKDDAGAFNATIWGTEGKVTRHEDGSIKRRKNNAVGIDFLVIDIDNKVNIDNPSHVSINDAIEIYCSLEYILYTSFSHTDKRHRFRIMLPLTRPILKEELEPIRKTPVGKNSLVTSLTEIFPGSDLTGWRLVQIFYEPACKPGAPREFHYNEGEWFDPDVLLEAEPGTSKPRDTIKPLRVGEVGGGGKIYYETFDIIDFCKTADFYKKVLDSNKHSVCCPFSEDHTEVHGFENGYLNDTETVVFTGNGMQTMSCSHTHGDSFTTAIKVAKELESRYGEDMIRPFCQTETILDPKVKGFDEPEELQSIMEAIRRAT